MTIEQKVDKILDNITELKVQQAEHIAYTKSNQRENEKKLTEHEAKIIVLEASRNQKLGEKIVTQSIFGMVAGSIGAGIVALFKHF